MSTASSTGRLAQVVASVLEEVSGKPAADCLDAGLHLQNDLLIDSLALLEVVEILQRLLGIVVPDESVARLRTVDDVIQAAGNLLAAAHYDSKGPDR